MSSDTLKYVRQHEEWCLSVKIQLQQKYVEWTNSLENVWINVI
jgi:hypothetical protein